MKTQKTYSFETLFRSLKEALCAYLKKIGVPFEVSATGPFCGWYFSITCTVDEANDINGFIDSITITEQRA